MTAEASTKMLPTSSPRWIPANAPHRAASRRERHTRRAPRGGAAPVRRTRLRGRLAARDRRRRRRRRRPRRALLRQQGRPARRSGRLAVRPRRRAAAPARPRPRPRRRSAQRALPPRLGRRAPTQPAAHPAPRRHHRAARRHAAPGVHTHTPARPPARPARLRPTRTAQRPRHRPARRPRADPLHPALRTDRLDTSRAAHPPGRPHAPALPRRHALVGRSEPRLLPSSALFATGASSTRDQRNTFIPWRDEPRAIEGWARWRRSCGSSRPAPPGCGTRRKERWRCAVTDQHRGSDAPVRPSRLVAFGTGVRSGTSARRLEDAIMPPRRPAVGRRGRLR